MQDLTTNLADVKSQINEHVKHSYLFKYIKEPVIDEDKLLLFTSIFSDYDLPKSKAEQYIVTAMLVQIALDTHELVENGELDGEFHKSRQLTILAGTYYSGLYYKILSALEDVGMIRTLAEGIKEVNEHKISVYRKDSKRIDNLMESVKKIESALYERVLTHYNSDTILPFTANVLFYRRLLKERELFNNEEPSLLFEALGDLIFSKTHLNKSSMTVRSELLSVVDSYIDHARREISQELNQIPYMNNLLNKRIQEMIQFDQYKVKSYAEEG
ncbi:heptaprenyl diphosphate synthase component 1 [Cytobacillus gottheilii]|uniref:heptaprenyl diphosphate synthase component 1 n=1 Tax=Cytobacillus gottheilii TaxID=859144 RepID=UPI0009BACD60|nr:heptaprenyl diphosphate synthase component 1 [Cytobacillus gottheilii]